MIRFINQNLELANIMNDWINDEIIEFALFEYNFTDEYNYYNKTDMLPEIEKYNLYAVFDDELLIGYITLVRFKDDKIYGYTINPIVVNPKYQNKGYGKKIISKVIENIKTNLFDKASYIESIIDDMNFKSIKMFTACGFKPIQNGVNYKTYRYDL